MLRESKPINTPDFNPYLFVLNQYKLYKRLQDFCSFMCPETLAVKIVLTHLLTITNFRIYQSHEIYTFYDLLHSLHIR